MRQVECIVISDTLCKVEREKERRRGGGGGGGGVEREKTTREVHSVIP